MSVTHPGADFAPVKRHDLASEHPQLAPFLVAVSAVVALVFTGLPA